MPASNILIELSGAATVMSKAAEVPQSQLVTRVTAGPVLELSCHHPQPTSIDVQTDQLAVNHIAKRIVPGCCITSSLACDTVVTQRVKCTVGA